MEFGIKGDAIMRLQTIEQFVKGSIIGDFHQELITEFLWHGGRIRFDYPDGVARRDVDALFDLFKSALRQLLDACVGDVLVNDQMND